MELLLENKLLVERSRDPACDAARALLAKGITGKLTMQDKDGRPLCVIDIEKAAKRPQKWEPALNVLATLTRVSNRPFHPRVR